MSDNFTPMAKRLRASAAALRKMTASIASDELAPSAAGRLLASAQRIERCADGLDSEVPSERARAA